jgi:hypothetical protein
MVKRLFLGIINQLPEGSNICTAYLTNLCASVATKVKPSGENWKNTPDITGRKSSLPAAKLFY